MEQTFKMERPKLLKILLGFALMIGIGLIPPAPPLTKVGMRTLGVFVGTVVLLSTVDTTWPAILCIPLFGVAGVMTVNEAIIGSLGNWITTFVLMSFILTHALNETGFTGRLTARYMSRPFVQKSPWVFTFSLISLGMIVGWFLDPVPTTAFFMGFSNKIFKELGYSKDDSYPHMVTMGLAFAINIAGGMTPISHPLALMGIGIYQQLTGNTISLFQYLIYGMPTGLIIMVLMFIFMRLIFKPDFENFENFDVKTVLDEIEPMTLREKTTVAVFFGVVTMWILPGILTMFAPEAALTASLNKIGPTFWALIGVVILAVLEIDHQPVLDLQKTFKEGISWGTVFLVAAAILLGGAVTSEKVGFQQFLQNNITELIGGLSPMIFITIIVFFTSLMTNFTSNVTTISLMASVGVSIAMATPGVSAATVALGTTMAGALAYMIPASFASIGVLYGNKYSKGSVTFKFGGLMVLLTTLGIATVGTLMSNLIF